MLLVTQHTATQTCRVHTTCYNKQHTYTQHMHTTQMICTSYHHQRPSSTLSMGGRRRGKWTVDVNPVNSEQHMHYIHLVIKEQHCSGECLHRRLSQSSHARALCIGAATHSPPQVSITASARRLFAISGYCLSCYISVYISATELHPKCGVTLHMSQYRKVTLRQVAMLLKSMIKTLSKSDWYRRHCTSCGVRMKWHSKCLT